MLDARVVDYVTKPFNNIAGTQTGLAVSNVGLLSRFIGMVTDSRSFMSFPRHEYFRRVLCNLLGTDIENGELPNDETLIGNMVRPICFHNAADYLGLELGPEGTASYRAAVGRTK